MPYRAGRRAFRAPEAWLIETVAQLVRAGTFFIPASLGATEAAMVLVYEALVGAPSLGFAVALIRRARELLWIAWGLWLGWLEVPGAATAALTSETAGATGAAQDGSDGFYACQPARFATALALALANWLIGMGEIVVIMWFLGAPVTLEVVVDLVELRRACGAGRLTAGEPLGAAHNGSAPPNAGARSTSLQGAGRCARLTRAVLR